VTSRLTPITSHRLRSRAPPVGRGARAPGPRRVATPLAAVGLQRGRARTLDSQWPAGRSQRRAGWGCAASLSHQRRPPAPPTRCARLFCARRLSIPTARAPAGTVRCAWPWHHATVPQGHPARRPKSLAPGWRPALFVPIPQGSRTPRGASGRGARAFAGRPGPRGLRGRPVHVRA
jgi:hypothetical protein